MIQYAAIWYDGYLVPGENFDDAIQDAIDMSDLFVLAVTPNLLENPNYVITQEYPAAHYKGIEILPVHGAPTNPKQLKALFDNIPEGVDYVGTSAYFPVAEASGATSEMMQEGWAAIRDELYQVTYKRIDIWGEML